MTLFLTQAREPQVLRVQVETESPSIERERDSKISSARLLVYRTDREPEALRFFITIKGPSFKGGSPPSFQWQLIPGDITNRIFPVLRIRLARGAYIENLSDMRAVARIAFEPPFGSRAGRVPLALEVIRTEDRFLPVEIGQEQTMIPHGFSPMPWHAIAARLWSPVSHSPWTSTLSLLQTNQPVITQLPDGLLIEKRSVNGLAPWKVRITTPLTEPAAFAYNCLGPNFSDDSSMSETITDNDRQYLMSQGPAFTIRIVKTLNVDVHVHVERSSRVSGIDFNLEYHVVDNTVRHDPIAADLILPELPTNPLLTEGWNYIGKVPEQGSYLDPELFQFYSLTHANVHSRPTPVRTWSEERLSQFQIIGDPITISGRLLGHRLGRVAPRLTSSFTSEIQFAINAFEITIGLIPIVGTLYDIASILYLSSTGRSFWGERREISWVDLLGIGAIGFGFLDEAAAAAQGLQRSSDVFQQSISRGRTFERVIEHVDPPLRSQLPDRVARPSAAIAETAPRTTTPRRTIIDITEPMRSTFSTRGQEILSQAARRARQRESRQIADIQRVIDELGREFDGALAEVLVDLPNSEFARFLSGLTESTMARRIFEIGEPYTSQLILHHERRRLLSVLSPDFSEFNNDILAQGYRAYVSLKHARGLRARSLVDWIAHQRSGQYRAELELILGSGFTRRIRRARALGTTSALDSTTVSLFREMQQHIESYTALVARRRSHSTSTMDLGAFFDADHLLEKRFIHQLRTRLPDFDTGSLQALIVPKHQRVLTQLHDVAGTRALRTYDHSTKTQLMRAMLPYQEEHLFSLQQWWDAHVWTYRQLSVHNIDSVLAALRTDFQRVATELGESFTPRLDITDLNLLPENMIGRTSSMRSLP